MAASPSEIGKVRRPPSRLRFVAPAMLFVAATLATLLWLRAVPAVFGSIGGLLGGDEIVATVVACDPPRGGCQVSPVTSPGQVRTYDEPGLFAPAPGSVVTVVERDGRLVQAGYPALAEAALLAFLAVCFTGFTLSWLRRVLDAAPIMPDDYGVLDPRDP